MEKTKWIWIIAAIVLAMIMVKHKQIVAVPWGEVGSPQGFLVILSPKISGPSACIYNSQTQTPMDCYNGCNWDRLQTSQNYPYNVYGECVRCPKEDMGIYGAWSYVAYNNAYRDIALAKQAEYCNVVATCNTNADANCNGDVSDSELLAYINLWLSGSVTDTKLLQAAQAWLS